MDNQNQYVIAGYVDDEDGTLYWSNLDGWVTLESATVFSATEYDSGNGNLPLGDLSRWVKLPSPVDNDLLEPNAEPMKVVYVVGFSPDFTHWHGDNARVGGFDWRVDFFAARKVMLHHLNEDTGHDYVMRSVQVPRSLNGDEITDYLRENADLWEIPLPADWCSPNEPED